uniref:RING-type E3 ubiquitin transferase n=1 Tax=Ditylenchus dipsaci TaxID=166011 RepID=A0A915CQK2_9BILA
MTPSANQSSQQHKSTWSSFCCPGYFSEQHVPLNLVCGHALCYLCVQQPATSCCPLDQTEISDDAKEYPVNLPLLSILGIQTNSSLEKRSLKARFPPDSRDHSTFSTIESLLITMTEDLLYVFHSESGLDVGTRKSSGIPTLRTIAENIMTEMILAIQNSSYISSNLWTAVRSRGCQFLGPAMQQDALRLILQTLSKGEMVARKTLVMHVVQSLSVDYPHVSKTCIGHVVQLLYRASCFNVIKRDGESSLMQLKEEFRDYESLRLEHDSQIIQIACEANLKISSEQWSSLLYGDLNHRTQIQSIVDKLWISNPFQMFSSAIIELKNCGLSQTEEFEYFQELIQLLNELNAEKNEIENADAESLLKAISNSRRIIDIYVIFFKSRKLKNNNSNKKQDMRFNSFIGQRLYKTRLCREIAQGKVCLLATVALMPMH